MYRNGRFGAKAASALLLATTMGSPLFAQQAEPDAALSAEPPADVASQPEAALGEGAGGDIIVTARRRSERLQDVPVAVTALSGDDLAERRIDSAESLRFAVPALQVSPSSFGKAVPAYTIRSQRALESIITQDPAVGIYFAEQVQQRAHGTNSTLYDLASVEVLKGPQGTLFGRNTTGGAVLINPARPTFEFEGSIEALLGNYDHRRGTAVLNIPLSDTVAVRFAGRITRRDGFVKNLSNGLRTDDDRTDSGRFSVLFEPDDNFSSYTVFNYFHEDDASAGFVLAKLRPGSTAVAVPGVSASFQRQQTRADFWSVENNQQPFAQVESWSATNITTLRLGPVTLKNIFGYRNVKSFVGFDYDGSSAVLFESRNRLNTDQWSEEFQLSGDLSDRLNYIGGVYWFRERGRDVQNSILFGTRANDGEGTNESYSAYAQFGYKLAEPLNLTVGGRYTIDDRQLFARNLLNGACRLTGANGAPLNPCFLEFDKTFRSPSWLASLDYKVTPDALLYVAHRRGYRSGGWNLRANRPSEQVPFEPEEVYDIELGVKAELFDRRVRLNAAAYQQWYKRIQRTLSFIPAPGQPLSSVVLNAGTAQIKGGELEVTARPLEWFELRGSLAYSNAEYSKFTAPGLGDLTANKFAMAPEWTYTLSGRINLPVPDAVGRISLAANYYHQSQLYISDLNQGVNFDLPVDGYGVLDLTADWENVGGRPFDLGLFVKNLAKAKYYTGGASVYASVGTSGETLGEPRHFGVSLRYRFGAAAIR
jgi:iron complex outermembrane recepter protein